jgi:hypothetical protein
VQVHTYTLLLPAYARLRRCGTPYSVLPAHTQSTPGQVARYGVAYLLGLSMVGQKDHLPFMTDPFRTTTTHSHSLQRRRASLAVFSPPHVYVCTLCCKTDPTPSAPALSGFCHPNHDWKMVRSSGRLVIWSGRRHTPPPSSLASSLPQLPSLCSPCCPLCPVIQSPRTHCAVDPIKPLHPLPN